jgi:5-methylcytosine-specific restriction endonuclease McrA
MPYQAAQFEHEEIAPVPRGWKVRTTSTPTGAQVRVAYPPGPRRRGSGRLISILHPNPAPTAHRKAVDEITDRAKRYRANARPPAGLRRCELCGSTRNVVIDHRDGNESNGRRRNLRWLCQGCNISEGARNARLGRGVPTRQYNPGVDHSLLSPSGHMSKAARARALERTRVELFGPAGLAAPTGPKVDPKQNLLREAALLRDLAARGMSVRKYTKQAEKLEAEAARMNPGARNLAAYTEAALAHTRGAHDYGGAIIHETPIEHRRKFAREIWRRRRGEAPRAVKLNPAMMQGMICPKCLEDLGESIPVPAGQLCPGCATFTAPPLKAPAPRRVRLNPPPMAEAIEKYTQFHGRPPREILDAQRSDAVRKTYVILGEHPSLIGLEIAGPECDLDALDFESMDADDEIAGAILLEFDGDNVDLASDPRGHQLYLIGGDQSLDPEDLAYFDTDTQKDLIELGPAVAVEYQARKSPRYQLARYRHFLGEHSGQQPVAFYDRLKKEIALVGGTYRVKDWIYD